LTADHPNMRRPRIFYVSVVSFFAVAVALQPAAARHSPTRHGPHESRHGRHESASAAPYAAIVVDANSGNVLHSDKADELRHPASLTKIMTLYLLFEKLDGGKIRLDSQIPVSEHASLQAPTKLGLKPGQSIEVEDAIRGLVTKSANDAAVAVAEFIGGTEHDFAEMMTVKARALGMSRTVYRNASGLPDDEQVTTARDQALLGRTIQERFPRYYRYFATPSFTYRGQTMRNHNQLLGHVEGMDGIKTGYTQASGFNLVASVRRDNRHIVSVVLGGTSAGARDARMRSLIESYIVAAAPQKTKVAAVAAPKADAAHRDEAPAGTRGIVIPPAPSPRAGDSRPADGPTAPATYSVASASSAHSTAWPMPSGVLPATSGTANQTVPMAASVAPSPAATAASSGPSADPIKPIQVKTIKVKMAPAQIATLAPAPAASPPTPAARLPPAPAAAHSDSRDHVVPAMPAPQPAAAVEEPKRKPERDLIAEAIRSSTPPEDVARSAPQPAPQVHYSGWMIQVGAFDVEREARDRLNAVQAKVGPKLKHANPFTEAVVAGDKTFYRARFAGIQQKDEAEAICKQLKRNDIACMTIKN
jgi:D-alanyl-D-alanine carboxypeptidase